MAVPARPIVRGPADGPTSVVIMALDAIEAGARPLIVDESSGQLAAAVHARGGEPQVWRRFASAGDTTSPWPVAVECTSAFVRLGKDRRALAMALDAAASVVAPGGMIVLFGANVEGVKSAGKALDEVAENAVTVDTRRHSRVLAGRRRHNIPGQRGSLDAWRAMLEISLNGHVRPWISYPGVFAGGQLDDGTAMLLDHLSAIPRGAAVLDMACGSGIIGAVVRERIAEAGVDLVDNDAVAIAAARENVPGATVICGGGLAAAPRERYDAILANPPIHDGVTESFAFLQQLIAEAPSRLKHNGILQIVIQRRIRALPWFEAAFKEAAIVAQDRRFQIIRGVAGSVARPTRRGAR